MTDIILSIYVATYNHESYISRALDSILMQKTEYRYEVLIGEDFSPDGTRKILKEYEDKYPGKFQVFYRNRNMNQEVPNNAEDLISRCKGKYIIALEGDDYWTDTQKINRQIKFLESHPDYLAVAHRCTVVDENSCMAKECYPECTEKEYRLKYFASEIMPGQLTTVMYRNVYRDEKIDTSLLNQGLMPWDRLLYFTLASNGKIYCMQKKMSAYRHVTNAGTSFSANYKYSFEDWHNWHLHLLRYSQQIEQMEAIKYAEALYLRNIFRGLKRHQCCLKDVCAFIKYIRHPMRAILLYIKYKINKNVLHKKIWI